MMPPFTHIIAKQKSDRWRAWFEDTPHIQSIGNDAIDAIYKLMVIHRLTHLNMVRIVSVDDGTAVGQMEILAHDRSCSTYPIQFSKN